MLSCGKLERYDFVDKAVNVFLKTYWKILDRFELNYFAAVLYAITKIALFHC